MFTDVKKEKKRKQVPVEAPENGKGQQPSGVTQKKRRKQDANAITPAQASGSEEASLPGAHAAQTGAAAAAGEKGDSGLPAARRNAAKSKKKTEKKQASLIAEPCAPQPGEKLAKDAAAAQDEAPRKKRSRNKFKPDGVPLPMLDRPKKQAATGQPGSKPQPETKTVPPIDPQPGQVHTKAAVKKSGQTGSKVDGGKAAGKRQQENQVSKTATAANQTPVKLQREASGAKSAPAKQKDGGLLAQMRAKLSGGRFRWLNEQLYTCPGEEALELMQGQPHLFQQYHEVPTHVLPHKSLNLGL